MITDLLEVYRKIRDLNNDIAIDNYSLKEGIYIRWDITKSVSENFEVIEENSLVYKYNKDELIENREIYDWFKIRDFYSNYVNEDSNKMMDIPGRKIHNTNFFTLFMKEDVLLYSDETDKLGDLVEYVKKFYNVLLTKKDQLIKTYPVKIKNEDEVKQRDSYFKDNFEYMLTYAESDTRIDMEKLINKEFICKLNEIKELLLEYKDKAKFNNYIKFFIDVPLDWYEKEYLMYLVPKTFVNNSFNKEINGKLSGLPGTDMTVNDKKPFLKLKSMNIEIPTRESIEDSIDRKDLYSWLGNNVKRNKLLKISDILGTEKREPSYAISMEGKSIAYFENVPFEKVDELNEEVSMVVYRSGNSDNYVDDKPILLTDLYSIQQELSRYYFAGKLKGDLLTLDPKVGNGFSGVMSSALKMYRDSLYDWFVKGDTLRIKSVIDIMTYTLLLDMIKNKSGTDKEEYLTSNIYKAFNLRLFLIDYLKEGDVKMSDELKTLHVSLTSRYLEGKLDINSENEFYYLMGQTLYYLQSMSEKQNKTLDFVGDVLRLHKGEALKRKLDSLFILYGHAVGMYHVNFNKLVASLVSYKTTGKMTRENRNMLMAGLLNENIYYTKKNKIVEDVE